MYTVNVSGDAAATNSKKTLEKRSGLYKFGKKSEQVEEKFEKDISRLS